jgi:hypothetical protein
MPLLFALNSSLAAFGNPTRAPILMTHLKTAQQAAGFG